MGPAGTTLKRAECQCLCCVKAAEHHLRYSIVYVNLMFSVGVHSKVPSRQQSVTPFYGKHFAFFRT